jgi:hypothetical protein
VSTTKPSARRPLRPNPALLPRQRVRSIRSLDTRPADPPQYRRWRSGLLPHWCPAQTSVEALAKIEGHRWAIEDSFETAKNRVGPRPQRDPLLAWLASPCLVGHAGLRHDGRHPSPRERPAAPKNDPQTARAAPPPLIRWSVQEIRRIAIRQPTAYPTSPHHRMVALAKSTSGFSAERPYQNKNATVMLDQPRTTSLKPNPWARSLLERRSSAFQRAERCLLTPPC